LVCSSNLVIEQHRNWPAIALAIKDRARWIFLWFRRNYV